MIGNHNNSLIPNLLHKETVPAVYKKEELGCDTEEETSNEPQ